MNQLDRLNRSLTNQAPTAAGIERIEEVRAAARELAAQIISNCPESRERSLACTHLEETTMWAIKSIVLET